MATRFAIGNTNTVNWNMEMAMRRPWKSSDIRPAICKWFVCMTMPCGALITGMGVIVMLASRVGHFVFTRQQQTAMWIAGSIMLSLGSTVLITGICTYCCIRRRLRVRARQPVDCQHYANAIRQNPIVPPTAPALTQSYMYNALMAAAGSGYDLGKQETSMTSGTVLRAQCIGNPYSSQQYTSPSNQKYYSFTQQISHPTEPVVSSQQNYAPPATLTVVPDYVQTDPEMDAPPSYSEVTGHKRRQAFR